MALFHDRKRFRSPDRFGAGMSGTKSNGRIALARVIAQYRASDSAVIAAERALRMTIQKHSEACRPARILGGCTGPMAITVDGKSTPIKSRAFYFQTHAEIDRETAAAKLKAASRAEVRKADADRRRLHSALRAEERRVAKAIPVTVRNAEQAANRAGAAYSAAFRTLVRFKPKTALQGVDFLAFLSSEPDFCSSDELAACLRNIAAAVRSDHRKLGLT